MKTINPTQVDQVDPFKLRRGHIVAHGVILNIRPVSRGFFLDVPGNQSVYAEVGVPVQVLARISDEMVDAIVEAEAAYRQEIGCR